MNFANFIVCICLFAVTAGYCATGKDNAYESATQEQMMSYKKIRLPFPSGTKFFISQGAFGTNSHNESGNEYQWDFDVPYGTPVVSVDDGMVYDVWEPNKGGGCNSKYSNLAHNVKIEHKDRTVAQYVHISSKVKKGDHVHKGQVIAVTAMNGQICQPQLHFGIYKSKDYIYSSINRQSIPLAFDGLPNFGKASEGISAIVP